MKKLFGSIALLLSILACGSAGPTPSQLELETIVAATLGSLTATAQALPTKVNGTSIAINNIAFVIPTEIGNGANSTSFEAVPPTDDMPWWSIMPAHHQYEIQGYVLQNRFHKPLIYVYPVEEYTQLDEDIAALVNNLKTILGSPDQPLPERLPFLPTFNAAQIFYSNAQMIPFQNGSGIRYITQYGQGALPINNQDVFYTFQGLTNDGKYYIAAVLPISNSLLVEDIDQNSTTPSGGIPFEWNSNTFEFVPRYIESVTQVLNLADPNSFNPRLSSFDQFIQSINVALP